MTQVQSGILLEHCRFAIFMEATVQGEFADLRQGLQAVLPDVDRAATAVSRCAFGRGDRLWL